MLIALWSLVYDYMLLLDLLLWHVLIWFGLVDLLLADLYLDIVYFLGTTCYHGLLSGITLSPKCLS